MDLGLVLRPGWDGPSADGCFNCHRIQGARALCSAILAAKRFRLMQVPIISGRSTCWKWFCTSARRTFWSWRTGN